VSVLKDLHMDARIGATVVAPDGQLAAVWCYTSTHELWLWRDGALLPPVDEKASRQLELVGAARPYSRGAAACSRANHPDAPVGATRCPTCGITILKDA
jgi:hypothetical protein